MSHIRETVLERYVLRPDLLDGDGRAHVESHLEECALCRGTANTLRSFHADLTEHGSAGHPAVDRLLRGMDAAKGVIRLHPYHPDTGNESRGYTTVLAAAGAPSAPRRFVTLATLAAEERQLVVKLVRDGHEGRATVYVQTSDALLRRFALFVIPEARLEVLTDDRGRGTFSPESVHPAEFWDSVHALLVQPTAEVRLDPRDLAGTDREHPFVTTAVTLWREPGAVTLRVAPASPPATLVYLHRPGREALRIRLSGGGASFPHGEGTSPFTLLLYP